VSGISTGIGIFSGIDSASLIEQLLAVEARPKILAQQRLMSLQLQQSGFLDINSALDALKSAASGFRLNSTFDSMQAASTNEAILSAIAGTSATPGSYSFIVDRLVTSQQVLSRGFTDSDTTGLGAESFSFESIDARLDRDVALSELKGGDGVARGKITINDGTSSQEIDLSKAITVNDVIDAINSSGLNVSASISGDQITVSHTGAGTVTIADVSGYTMASEMGLTGNGASITSDDLYTIADNTSLAMLNDGNGVYISNTAGTGAYDFTITIDNGAEQASIQVNLGDVWEEVTDPDTGELTVEITESAVSTMDGVITRINDAITEAQGTYAWLSDVSASIGADGASLAITDSAGTKDISVTDNAGTTGDTAADLGIATSAAVTGTLNGDRILATLNSTLSRNLNGGSGITGDGQLSITDRAGNVHTLTVDTDSSLSQVIDAINTATGGAVTASLNTEGTGLLLTDSTSGSGNLIVTGTSGDDTAESLGISTGATGVAADTVTGSNIQHQYISESTLVSTLSNGRGIGTGSFIITDSTGDTATVNISDSARTLGDVLKQINANGTMVRARINDTGDGILLYEDPSLGTPGTLNIKVEDDSGIVASRLNIAGEGDDTDNEIDGTYEQTVTFDATDTLADIATAINEAGVGVAASVINDGTSSNAYHLNLSATTTGRDGRMIIDTGSLDMDFQTLSEGTDAVVFFGSSDPAHAVLLTSSSNTLDDVLGGVSIDLHSADDEAVTLTITRDTAAIESAVNGFLDAFNSVIDRIDYQSRYDVDTETKGALLGDGTLISLRNALFSTIQGEAQGITGSFTRLSEIGVKVESGGKLTLDSDRFRAAMEQDPAGVEELFAAYDMDTKDDLDLGDGATAPNTGPDTFSSLGIAGQMEELVKTYINSVDGVLTQRNKTLDDQISLQNKRIEQFDEQLDRKRARLEAQFLAMEQALAQMSMQQDALSSLTSLAG
jgi:flagellar hook-associated protein 2